MTVGQRRLAFAAGFVMVCGLAAAGLSGAVRTEANHTYRGCYESNGDVYLIGENDLRSSCKKHDTEFTFSLRGPVGPPGSDGVSVTSTQLQPGNANCPTGGTRLVSANATTFVCNGAKGDTGLNGADGISVQATQLASGDANCPTGGVKLVAVNSTAYVCNGGGVADRYAGGYALYLNGAFAGPVHLVDGCAIKGEVITFRSGGDPVPQKALGQLEAEPCTMQIGFNMSADFWHWLNDAFTGSGTTPRRNGEIIRVDASGNPISGIDFGRALVSQLTVPAVQLGSSSAFDLTFTIKEESLATPTTLPGPLTPSQATMEHFQPSLTDFTIPSVGGGKPSSVDPLTITQTISEFRSGTGETTFLPTGIVVPDLGLHYAANNTTAVSDLQSWFASSIQGGLGTRRTTTLTVGGHHSGETFDHLVVLTFGRTGISRFDPFERESDGAYRANLYAETVSLDAHNSS